MTLSNVLRKEVLGFLAVGSIGAIVDFGVFNLLISRGQDPVASSFISISLAGVVVFIGNLWFTFGHVDVASRGRAALKFLLLTILTLSLSSALVTISLLALDNPGARESNFVKLTVVGLLVIGRFAAMKFWIYVRSQGLE